MKAMVLLLAGCALSSVTQADWLSLCDTRLESLETEIRLLRSIEAAGGDAGFLYAGAHPPESAHCQSVPLGIEVSHIEWTALTPRNQVDTLRLAKTLTFRGKVEGKIFHGEMDWPSKSISERALHTFWPPNFDIKDRVSLTPFGVEERAGLKRHPGALTLTCLTGKKPAGFLMHLGKEVQPQLMNLRLHLRYRSTDSWKLTRSPNSAIQQDPVPIHELPPSPSFRDEYLSADEISRAPDHSLGVICPLHSASIEIERLEFEAPLLVPAPIRSTWIWDEATWKTPPVAFWDQLRALNLSRVFVAFDLDVTGTRLQTPELVKKFIREATGHGISVWAVEGNPRAVLSSEQPKWIERARAYQIYNAEVPLAERILGLQLDVEPYINAGYAVDPDSFKSNYLELLKRTRKVIDFPLDVAVPFWWGQDTLNGESFVRSLNQVVDSITVMDYRTLPEDILTAAIPFLHEGHLQRKPVSIALETGDLGIEMQWRFMPSQNGHLAALPLNDLLIFVKSDVPFPGEDVIRFDLTQTNETRSPSITFHGRQKELEGMIEPLENSLRAWNSFGGLALHEVLKNPR
jgi:hypothetical protein